LAVWVKLTKVKRIAVYKGALSSSRGKVIVPESRSMTAVPLDPNLNGPMADRKDLEKKLPLPAVQDMGILV